MLCTVRDGQHLMDDRRLHRLTLFCLWNNNNTHNTKQSSVHAIPRHTSQQRRRMQLTSELDSMESWHLKSVSSCFLHFTASYWEVLEVKIVPQHLDNTTTSTRHRIFSALRNPPRVPIAICFLSACTLTWAHRTLPWCTRAAPLHPIVDRASSRHAVCKC